MLKFTLLSCLTVLALVGCGSGGVTLIYDTISPTPTVTLDAGQSITFTASVVNDSTNSGVNWQVNGVGTTSSITPTSVVYTAPATIAAGTTNPSVQAVPVKNSLFAAATLIVLNPALAISNSTLASGTIGTPYSTQLATTGGSGTITYALVSGALPAGLTLSATGLISGTPTALASSTFTVSATDSATTPATTTKILTLVITAPTLSITTASLPNGVSNQAYSVQLTAIGGVTPYLWSIASGALPSGMTLSTSGLLSGTPTSTGLFSVTFKVTDTEPTPQTATKLLNFTVYPQLVITTTTLPGGSVKNAYSATLAATGGTLPLTWSLASGTLPAGLTLSTAGVLNGTPTAAGTSTFTVQVTDKSSPVQTATTTYAVTIVLSTLAVTTTSLPQGTIGVTYPATQLTYSGGNPTVTWSLATGSTLPAGLSLSSAGVITGKPTGPAATTAFTVQATDTTPATVTQSLSITVVALATLTVSTTTLPAANIGSAYSTMLAATGGASPYTWAITSGSLPAGLTLAASTGVISGTPVAAGTYTFTVQITDSQGTPATSSRSLSLTVGTTLSAGPGNAMLQGSYAFLLQGYKNGAATGTVSGTAAIGSLIANGSGVITGGVEDTNASSGAQTSLAVTGTYSLGTDGRGLLILTAGTTTTVYALAASNLSGSVAQSLAITEFDNNTGVAGTANLAGFAKLQTSTAFNAAGFKGTYAFGLSGESPCASCATGVKLGPLAAVGVLTSDGVSAISAGAEDAAAYATNYTGVTFTGNYTAPSSTTGRGTLTVANIGTLFPAPPTTYTYVVVNASELLLLSNATHATTSLLAGDARLQTTTGYTAASLTGAVIGYESQGANGDGATTAPTTQAATLSRLVFTASGTATLAQDTNRAGTFTSTVASPTAVTYTTASTGRSVITTGSASNQVLYSYTGAAGFALDQAATGVYPALITYETQVADVSPYPPLLRGPSAYAASTLATAAPSTDTTGLYAFTLSTGGVNTILNGTLATTLDSSTPAGSLTLGAASSVLFLEDATGRLTLNANGSSTVQGVVYAITSTRAAAISSSTASTPTVTILQR